MDLLLGVDGGGTKTDIALKDSLGKVYLAHAAGSNHEAIGFERVRVLLKEGIEELLEQFGGSWKDIQAVCMGMSGIDFNIDKKNFAERVIHRLPFGCNFLIENDAYIALKTATGTENAIILNAGTGIKVLGIHGRKELYSNAAGIDSFQRRILNAMGKELELNRNDKSFSFDLSKILEVEDPYDYLQWIFLFNDSRREECPYSEAQIRNFPMAFFKLLKNGNSKAKQIFESLIADYTELAAAMAFRLELRDKDFELVLSGSIFSKNRDLDFEKLFFSAFIKAGSRVTPKEIIVLKEPHYLGALFEAERIRKR